MQPSGLQWRSYGINYWVYTVSTSQFKFWIWCLVQTLGNMYPLLFYDIDRISTKNRNLRGYCTDNYRHSNKQGRKLCSGKVWKFVGANIIRWAYSAPTRLVELELCMYNYIY